MTINIGHCRANRGETVQVNAHTADFLVCYFFVPSRLSFYLIIEELIMKDKNTVVVKNDKETVLFDFAHNMIVRHTSFNDAVTIEETFNLYKNQGMVEQYLH